MTQQITAEPLKIVRTRTNWTLSQLAQAADVSIVTLSHIENGLVKPLHKTKQKIEYALGVRVDWRATYDKGRINHTPQQRNGKSKITNYKED